MATGNGGSGRDVLLRLLMHAEETSAAIERLQTRMATAEVAAVGLMEQAQKLAAAVRELREDTVTLQSRFVDFAEGLSQLGSFLEAAQGANDDKFRKLEARLEKLERKAG